MLSRVARSAVVTLVLAGVVVASVAAAPAPQAAPISLADYWAHVQATLTVVEGLDAHQADAAHLSLEKEAAAWEAVTSVRLGSGTVVPLDTSSLVSKLRATPPDPVGLRSRLQSLLDARDHWLNNSSGGGAGSSSADPMLALSQVLSDKDFQWDQGATGPGPIQAWLNKIEQQFWQWLISLLPSGSADVSWLRWVVVAFASLVLLAVLWYTLTRITTGLVAEDELDGLNGDGSEIITSDSAMEHAQETSRAGDYRSAVRWLYLSSLLTLEERGLLRFDRTRTNREYLRSVANTPELAHSLRDVIDVFDRVWYGFQTIDSETFAHYARRVTDLRRIR